MTSRAGTHEAATSDIDAVIFDFAGVLSSSPGEAMAEAMKGFEIDPATFISIVMGPLDVDGDHPWHQLERGTLTVDEYLAAIEVHWRSAGFESFRTPFSGDLMATLRPIPEMVEAARAVRAAGYRTAILTNNVREWGSWRTAWDADNLVDAVIDSSEVGLRKPNRAIFELTLDRLGGVHPSRALFLDDFPWNIAGAEAAGLQTMRVADPVSDAAVLLDRLL